MDIQINATKRVEQGTGASRRLRRTGRVPGILYGGADQALPISIDHNEIWHQLKHEAFHSSILTMNLDGAREQVLLRDVQMHAYKRLVMHLDFQRVDVSHKIHVKVPLHFVNADIAPGVKLQGGIASHTVNELDIECLPRDLPEFIEVDLKDLSLGNSLHVTDLKLPAGVQAVLHKGENPVVASIVLHKGAAAEEVAVEGEAAAAATAAAPAPAATAPAKQPEKK
jgi:large subunit ribosomal protein L25